jgi:membrane protease YdiL (CAAX protease family)
MKSLHLVHAGVLLVLLTLPSLVGVVRPWPLYLLAPLTAYALVVVAVPPLRTGVRWLRFGRLNGVVLAWTAAIILGSSAALILWFVLARPDVSVLREKIPHVGPMQLLLIGVLFSLTNALMEEAIFRGVFQEALTVDWGSWPAIGVQAVMFGAIHAQGFPHGLEGMVMASVYGVALGWLRLRSGGMAASCIAHVCADATIFCLLVLPAAS